MTFTTEFQYRRYVKKMEAIEAIVKGAGERMGEAARFGDVGCENAEFQYAEQNLQTDLKVAQVLRGEMQGCEVLYEKDISTESIEIGTSVRVKNLETEVSSLFNIVGVGPSDIDKDEVSYLSPIGDGLMGLKKGSIETINIPAGERRFEVMEITKYFPKE